MPARLCLAALALALTACGVPGDPYVPGPMFGQTDLPPRVPEPYDRDDLVLSNTDLDYQPALTIRDQDDAEFGATLEEEEANQNALDGEMADDQDREGAE